SDYAYMCYSLFADDYSPSVIHHGSPVLGLRLAADGLQFVHISLTCDTVFLVSRRSMSGN
ncbi:MAG TPA: hypothetical protein VHO84_13650, partial [Syntrophorhabdaceae bacterium]|nr:hypothetical protein [Syntrophorhabdaceae bacterium]